ncbi:indole-3-acetate O-methyltransferase 1 isoform X2 [Cryptomeria japonica]|uniref:indole-3-acetate O-methyltransferase 1 isoform X2 n=1 Tax=Cryptomeria japonica TaxID=3369 RepID=UPI0027DA92A6|nr:indole-3-acetate O-methyltransferase 1 isoform X2 [Cryptomeria japonica]
MRLTSNVGGIFRVADFGCGTGENTLVVANTIVNAVQRSFEEHEIPEFEVPESVQQRRSPRVYVSGDFEESVGAAYLVQQFDKDFTAFLKARAEELVDGGCMFVSLPGRNEGTHMMEEQGICGFVARQIECAFEELVNEGIVEKEKWESFKIPFFGSNSDEEESIVKKEGSFVLKFVKTLEGIYPYCMIDFERGEENIFGRLIANNYRAAFENIVETHLGCKRSTEELFFRIGKRASILIEEYLSKETKLVVAFLIKKGVHNKTY